LAAKKGGFSLHAGIACGAHQCKKLEVPHGVPLCRYITRPAIAEQRLSLVNIGNVIGALKTNYDDDPTETRGLHGISSSALFIWAASEGRNFRF
jgi:hypothetical protein